MFVEERTRPVLAEVCRILNRSASAAVLLRHHSNAVYAVDDWVIKIAPAAVPVDRLRVVVALVEWLAAQGFPTVPLVPSLDQPLHVQGHAVTVWQRFNPGVAEPVSYGELGALLSRLHALDSPPIALPTLDPGRGIRHSIDASEILTIGDRALLVDRLVGLTEKWRTMTFPLGRCLIQADPQVRNALRRGDGTAVLADWDTACRGPRAWDVATVAVHCRRFGPAHAFDRFVATYGWDPRAWTDFEDLCRLRELQMIATNARKSAPGSPAAQEVRRRIDGLREGEGELTAWNIL